MEKLQLEIGDWQEQTFPDSTISSVLSHLAKEIIELSDAVKEGNTEKIKEELADCQHLIFGAGNKVGVNVYESTIEKFGINKKREWGKPDKNGVVEHLR